MSDINVVMSFTLGTQQKSFITNEFIFVVITFLILILGIIKIEYDHIKSTNTNDYKPARHTRFECAICLQSIESNCRILKCRHAFHDTCINRWLNIDRKCPTCKMYV